MIRSTVFNIVFWPTFIIYIAIMYPFAYVASTRNVWRFVYKPVTRWLLFCLKNIASVTYEIKNMKKIPKGQVIIGCNHQSTWETFIFALLFDELSIVIKKELLRKPIAGLYFRKLGCIPVDRSSPILAIKTILKYGQEVHKKGKSILIFPNGTRSKNDDRTEYKSGIFALYKTLDIPVIPAHVNSGRFWQRKAYKKIPGTIILEFKDPIFPGLKKDEFFKQFEKKVGSNQEMLTHQKAQHV